MLKFFAALLLFSNLYLAQFFNILVKPFLPCVLVISDHETFIEWTKSLLRWDFVIKIPTVKKPLGRVLWILSPKGDLYPW